MEIQGGIKSENVSVNTPERVEGDGIPRMITFVSTLQDSFLLPIKNIVILLEKSIYLMIFIGRVYVSWKMGEHAFLG
jgi:hypothetical protein